MAFKWSNLMDAGLENLTVRLVKEMVNYLFSYFNIKPELYLFLQDKTLYVVKKKQIVLFIGLAFFLIAFFIRLTGMYPVIVWICMSLGIVMKISFLGLLFKEEGFKMTPGLCLILTGVTIIFISLFLRKMEWWPLLANILFYTAIICKVTGVTMVLYKKAVSEKPVE